MFRPIPMYETNAIQLHFIVRLFWYLSQWSGLICSIFCTRLYSKDIHCAALEKDPLKIYAIMCNMRRLNSHRELGKFLHTAAATPAAATPAAAKLRRASLPFSR